jgi:hypothetical protein
MPENWGRRTQIYTAGCGSPAHMRYQAAPSPPGSISIAKPIFPTIEGIAGSLASYRRLQ